MNLPKQLADKWAEAERTGAPVEIGRLVVCDICGEDFTDRPDVGGFIFTSKAYCPHCAPNGLQSIVKYGEERFIRAYCPEGRSFADFVRAYRGPRAAISVRGKQP